MFVLHALHVHVLYTTVPHQHVPVHCTSSALSLFLLLMRVVYRAQLPSNASFWHVMKCYIQASQNPKSACAKHRVDAPAQGEQVNV